MEMDDKTYKVFRTMYQHLCDCQDLAESVGDFTLMRDFENFRHKLDNIMYG